MEFGQAMLGAVIRVVYKQLTSPEVINFFRGSKIDQSFIDKLKVQLLDAEIMVADAEEKQLADPAVKDWVDELKHWLYRAEEVVDEIDAMAAYASSLRSNARIIRDIEEIITMLDRMLTHNHVLGLRELSAGIGNRPPPSSVTTTSLVQDSEVYGREEERDSMIDFLLSEEQLQHRISVVAVLGMAGIGKTTLAQLVYNDTRVREHFDLTIWVRVLNQFDISRVTKSILESVARQSYSTSLGLNFLLNELRERLSYKRFLLVLDDVFIEEYVDWKSLPAPLLVGARGSKIIITTRNDQVASIMSRTLSFRLKPLADDDSWSLFCRHASQAESSSSNLILEGIGRKIVSKCGGSPLAIKTVAGLLRGTHDISKWEAVLHSSLWELVDNTNSVIPSLRVSYHHLPPYLKRCFSYCAIFPKGHMINRKQLVLLWMAENFILSTDSETSIEDTGDCYVRMLLSWSFLEPLDESYVVMSNLMHDLAHAVSGDFIKRLEHASPLKLPKRARHFSYGLDYFDGNRKFEAIREAKYLRTFLQLGNIREDYMNSSKDGLFLTNRVTSGLIPHLHYLRVLSLSEFEIFELPESIGHLKQLRYLDVSRTKISYLPESVVTLYNLQTLLLSNCDCLERLPANIRKLAFLRHLDISGTTSLLEMPKRMGELTNLQTLTSFVVGRNSGSNIKTLRYLHQIRGKFALRRLQNVVTPAEAFSVELRKKKCIDELELEFDSLEDVDPEKNMELLENLQPPINLEVLTIRNYAGMRFPQWLDPQCAKYWKMTFLCLSGCRYCDSLPPLGQLPSLKQLEIEGMDHVATVGPEFYGHKNRHPFHALVSLSFKYMKGWEVWENVDAGGSHVVFPSLKYLFLWNCPKLKGNLPIDLRLLEKSDIHGCEQLGRLPPQVSSIHTLEVPDKHGLSVSWLPTDNRRSGLMVNSVGLVHRAGIQATSERAPSGAVTETKGEMIIDDDLESEFYGSIEPRIPAAVSEAGPSDKTVVKPEVMSALSETNILTQEEAVEVAEQMHISHELQVGLKTSVDPDISASVSIPGPRIPVTLSQLQAGPTDETVAKPEMLSTLSEANIPLQEDAAQVTEQTEIPHDLLVGLNRLVELDNSASVSISGPSLETSVIPEIRTTTSVQTHHSEFDSRLSFQVEGSRRNKVRSLPKVNTDRPIHYTVKKILVAFRDVKSRRICLYGRGGSGKSTVLRTLSHHPASKHLFDQIIFVSIPRFDRRRKMQSQIAQQLSLNIQDSSSEKETAAQICDALTGRGRKVLLLLDDVWETMNLHEVGIPTGLDDGCWLVFTTRYLDVFTDMASREIEMEVLSAVEAWELLRYQVGEIVDSPEIEPCARDIAEECHGLPLIIIAVASALKMESSVTEWKLALSLFSDSSDSSNQYSASPHIKYCYDRLTDDGAKTCFLYCALFESDKEIDISVLVDCFFAEGLLGGRTSAAYRKGHDIVRLLVNVSLLEAMANGCKVKMHNVIRDSALAILSSSTEGFKLLTGSYLRASPIPKSVMLSANIDKYLTGAYAQLKGPLPLEEWAQAEMIFLMDNELSRLPSKPSCPTLEALFLQRNNCLRVIPTSFFDSMDALKILNFTKTRIDCLPDSFSTLKSLRFLVLRDCERLSIIPPSIGCLKALEVLDLQGTELTHLPDSVGELARLKQLRVSFYGSIDHREYSKLPAELIPNGVISRLIDLRDLGIFVHPGDQRWASSVTTIIDEMSSLKLSALYFHFPDEKHLDHFLRGNTSWKQGKLATFSFIVGHDFMHAVSQVSYDAEMMHNGEKQGLRFVNGENMPPAVQEILSGVTSFYLDHHLSICNLSDFEIHRLNSLRICILRDCPNIRVIVHDEDCPHSVFPVLEYLSINYLWNLEKIWASQVTAGSLEKLRYLSIQACPKLRYVLTCSMLDILSNLEELLIEDCESLDCIIVEDEASMVGAESSECVEKPSVYEISNITSGTPVLRSLKVLKLHYLPKLTSIWKGRWPPLEYVSFCDCPVLRNLCMEANDAMSIKEIAADKGWWGSLEWDHQELSRILTERVTQISLDDL